MLCTHLALALFPFERSSRHVPDERARASVVAQPASPSRSLAGSPPRYTPAPQIHASCPLVYARTFLAGCHARASPDWAAVGTEAARERLGVLCCGGMSDDEGGEEERP